MSDKEGNRKIILRRDPVDEILSERPVWILRYGSSVMLAAVLIMTVAAATIKLKEEIEVDVKININKESAGISGEVVLPKHFYTGNTEDTNSQLIIRAAGSFRDEERVINGKVSFGKGSDATSEGMILYTFSFTSRQAELFSGQTDLSMISQGTLRFTHKRSIADRFINSLKSKGI
ncbi:MAG: hypothetical protein PHP30_00910 [Bacteroidales bacterium]|nr:hypothetical protein [Bacteroidales bacterium]MDD2425045.1 hypothetical protein [Bacteroidales bacterium]MDD3988646.1 hypothetical protein [Bacteroidales bacterium]MDD4638328.1 hypothetical protein [Bacteroidales bacterium]